MKQQPSSNRPRRRNEALFDVWSVIHFVVSALLAVVLNPLAALIITLLWEPVENFIISPFLARRGVLFGHESLRNSLSDIVFNSAGIVFAVLFFAA